MARPGAPVLALQSGDVAIRQNPAIAYGLIDAPTQRQQVAGLQGKQLRMGARRRPLDLADRPEVVQ